MQRTGILLVRMKTNDKKIFGRWFEVMTAGTADKVALYWYAEPSVLTHRGWCGHCTHRARMHTNCNHATLTQTQAPTHARNTHTYTRSHARTQHSHARMQHSHAHTHACMHTRVHHTTNTHSHAQVLNLHVHAHTSGPDRHIHNQVIPAHGLQPCRACVNLCLSDLLPMRTDRWDPQGTWSI